jgi:hypothetical protein
MTKWSMSTLRKSKTTTARSRRNEKRWQALGH